MALIYLEAYLQGEVPASMFIDSQEIIGVYFKERDEYFTLLMTYCRNERILKKYLHVVMGSLQE